MDDAARSALWPETGSSRVPFELYKSAEIYERERERIFLGPAWSYLCLEAEIAAPGDYRASWVGDVPVVVARDIDGSLGAFENRCAHRGALIASDNEAIQTGCAEGCWIASRSLSSGRASR